VRVLLSLVIEARMLLKVKAVRCDLRKFSCRARFLIVLNLNRLSDRGGERGARNKERYVQSPNVIENKRGVKQ